MLRPADKTSAPVRPSEWPARYDSVARVHLNYLRRLPPPQSSRLRCLYSSILCVPACAEPRFGKDPMTFRVYDAGTDRAAVQRIWREVGWIENETHEKGMDVFLQSGRTLVADVNGAAECMVSTHCATLRYLEESLPVSGITGVTTSRIARKQGIASRLTARALADEASAGAAAALLGVFEQGFYNQLGFGNGAYEVWCTIDPAQLLVPTNARPPIRLTVDDGPDIHAARVARLQQHGAVSFQSPDTTVAEILWSDGGFGLGYRDESGRLTHHVWFSATKGENGPYRVGWLCYQTREQFIELLALLRNLGDQVHWVRLHEPPQVQLQDFLRQPFRSRALTETSKHELRFAASAYWQVRVLDVNACLAATHLDGGPLAFRLELNDPIGDYLPDGTAWRGVSGAYDVTFGPTCRAERATSDRSHLPVLRASVNAFSRLWLGIRSATSLSWSDDLSAPSDLLTRLDRLLRLPHPTIDWDF